jgi:hypothetical protein
MSDSQEVAKVRDKIEKENKVGGELSNLPCPFCRKPRSQRSTYIRCQPCAVNWFAGEDLSKDPKIARFAAVIAAGKKVGSVKEEAYS